MQGQWRCSDWVPFEWQMSIFLTPEQCVFEGSSLKTLISICSNILMLRMRVYLSVSDSSYSVQTSRQQQALQGHPQPSGTFAYAAIWQPHGIWAPQVPIDPLFPFAPPRLVPFWDLCQGSWGHVDDESQWHVCCPWHQRCWLFRCWRQRPNQTWRMLALS